MKKKKSVSSYIPRALRRKFPNLKTIIDAKQSVSIFVKKSDCDKAESLNPGECALARASKRQFHAEGAVIGLGSSYIIKGNKAIRFKTPQSVQREIVSFDRNHDFRPGQYNLPPMSPSLRFGIHQERKKKSSGSRKDSRKFLKHSEGVRILSEWKE